MTVKILRALIGSISTDVEILFVFCMPIYIYGWKIGLLVGSGLTSLLHIVQLLKKIAVSLDGQ